jgi:hypothetical protein
VKHNTSRGQFLQAGLALPVAGLTVCRLPPNTPRARISNPRQNKIENHQGQLRRQKGVSTHLARALDSGINYYDTARI